MIYLRNNDQYLLHPQTMGSVNNGRTDANNNAWGMCSNRRVNLLNWLIRYGDVILVIDKRSISQRTKNDLNCKSIVIAKHSVMSQ